MRSKKRRRQSELQSLLDSYPFLTDQQLADKFTVSIQTVRLDRMELGIPELRERLKLVASDAYAKKASLGSEELVGNLQECEPGVRALSSLDIDMAMVHAKTMTARAEHIFAQASSLALVAAGAPEGLVAEARVNFYRPVYAGEQLVSEAVIESVASAGIVAAVATTSRGDTIFQGKFLLKSGEGLA